MFNWKKKRTPTTAERKIEAEKILDELRAAYAMERIAHNDEVDRLNNQNTLLKVELQHLQHIIDRYESAERALALSNQAHGVAMKMTLERNVEQPPGS